MYLLASYSNRNKIISERYQIFFFFLKKKFLFVLFFYFLNFNICTVNDSATVKFAEIISYFFTTGRLFTVSTKYFTENSNFLLCLKDKGSNTIPSNYNFIDT